MSLGVLFDPLGKTYGPALTQPLKFVQDNPDFPPDGVPGKNARLIDVTPGTGFNVETSCYDLRILDAMITILYNYNPVLLEKVLDFKNVYSVTFKRFSYEMYDLDIERTAGNLMCRLYGKHNRLINNGRHSEPFLVVELSKSNWPFTPKNISKYTWKPRCCRKTAKGEWTEDKAEVERMGVGIARHILLARPWERNEGVDITLQVHEKKL